MQDCPGCQRFRWSVEVWCQDCLDSLKKIPSLSSDVITLYSYDEPLKRVLILYKATGSPVFESALLEALKSCEAEWTEVVTWCETIVCAPQSLSSWLQLKSNPPRVLGHYLSQRFGKGLRYEPCGRTFLKQSSRRRVTQHKDLLKRVAQPGDGRLLLIDDVLTSGGTFLKLASVYPRAQIKILALMRSRAMDL
ncbi:MAG: hypothetical protein WCI18_11605 [Pseudomonadota bacterium]